MSAASSYRVTSTFELTGRGVVAVVEETVSVGAGKELKVSVTRPDGTSFQAAAFQERLLNRNPTPFEHTAFLLQGVAKSAVPVGSKIQLLPHAV